MFKTTREAVEYIQALKPCVEKSTSKVMLAVPYTALKAASDAAKGSNIQIGAQNMHDAAEGAFTGEISSDMIKETGATFVLIGHSERRQYYGETNQSVNRKTKRALAEGLTPIVCIGETEAERESGQTEAVLQKQLSESLEGINLEGVIVAYEPVWAIGTGKTATPEIAQEAHKICRSLTSESTPILYGGSVKPENAADLMEMKDIDGALVGGASLKADSFAQIVNFGEKQ